MTVDDEPDAALSYWELPRRVGCLPTLLTMFYDQVLEEPLDPHECLIDFLAVSPDARGKGVGKALMQWAERTAVEILSRRVPQEVQSKGVRMTLWVAADNATACNLYSRSGYTVVKRTGEGLFACFSSRVFQRFLGHPIWLKMQKTLPPPETVGKDQPSKVITIVVDSAHRRSSLAAIAALEYAKQQQEEAAKVVATKKSASRAA